MRPLISILIPAYQQEQYLAACLDSVISQTYENLEILLADDGSTDRTPEICDQYAERDKRIQVIHQSHRGIAAVRNTLIRLANGDYYLFVDSDDTVSRHFVEILYSAGADIAQCRFTTDENLLSDICTGFTVMDSREASRQLLLDQVGFYTVLVNKLIKRSVFQDLAFPEGTIHEDESTAYRLLWNAADIAVSSDALYFYRIHSNSITTNTFSVRNLDALNAIKNRTSFYKEMKEPQLASLSEAVFCYRTAEMLSSISQYVPEQYEYWKMQLNHSYHSLMKDSNLTLKKKISLSLQVISPALHKKMKGIITCSR